MNGLRRDGTYIQWNTTRLQKNEIMLFAATWMQLEISILSEGSQQEKDKYHMISLMWNLKRGTNAPIYKTEINSQT